MHYYVVLTNKLDGTNRKLAVLWYGSYKESQLIKTFTGKDQLTALRACMRFATHNRLVIGKVYKSYSELHRANKMPVLVDVELIEDTQKELRHLKRTDFAATKMIVIQSLGNYRTLQTLFTIMQTQIKAAEAGKAPINRAIIKQVQLMGDRCN